MTRPHFNLVVYHGVLAPRARWRPAGTRARRRRHVGTACIVPDIATNDSGADRADGTVVIAARR